MFNRVPVLQKGGENFGTARTVSKFIGHADVGESHITRGSGILQETPGNKPCQIYCNGSVQIERPAQFKVGLTAYISRLASIARSHQRATYLVNTVIEAF